MKKILFIVMGLCLFLSHGIGQNIMEKKELSAFEKFVIEEKGTEHPYTGEYWNHTEYGSYHCKRCDALLYKSDDKFDSNCGWPSFDDEVVGAIDRQLDADGSRTEILCASCGAHLGHIFEGEMLTKKNVRHCVNSVSLNFVATASPSEKIKTERAIFASGCFWGTEYHMIKKKGVISTTVGYTGGTVKYPDYHLVCSGTTGHVEAVEVIFNPAIISYKDLVVLFFETHDFSQTNGQGPDIGSQYLSRIFYTNDEQKRIAEKTIQYLTEVKGYRVATKVFPANQFYSAEDYHQNYYDKKGSSPYCHIWRPIF